MIKKKTSPFPANEAGIVTGLLILSIALTAAGLSFVNISQQIQNRTQYAQTWPSVPGTVTQASLGDTKGVQTPVLEYTYQAGNDSLKGTRLLLSEKAYEELEPVPGGFRAGFRDPKKGRIDAEITQGMTVTVYHNPENPEDSVLYPVYAKDMKFFLIGGILLAGIGMLGGIRSLAED